MNSTACLKQARLRRRGGTGESATPAWLSKGAIHLQWVERADAFNTLPQDISKPHSMNPAGCSTNPTTARNLLIPP